MKTLTILTSLFFLLSFSESWAQTNSSQPVKISSKIRLCPKDTRRGDREFGGHGPDVTATARLTIENKTRVILRLSLHAIETKRDWTEAKGTWRFIVYQAPFGFKIGLNALNRSSAEASKSTRTEVTISNSPSSFSSSKLSAKAFPPVGRIVCTLFSAGS